MAVIRRDLHRSQFLLFHAPKTLNVVKCPCGIASYDVGERAAEAVGPDEEAVV